MLESDAQWNFWTLRIIYEIIGWLTFAAWSLSFYPQALLNFRRKSVIGLNFDFLVFNLTKHMSYLIFNSSLFFSTVVQAQYREKYGEKELIPVSASDVAFSIHAVLLTAIQGIQILMYERGRQRVSFYCKLVTCAVWSFAGFMLFLSWPHGDWLWLVTIFNYIQLFMTSIKYIPQAWFNYQRRSTEGWSVENVLLDITGGIGSFVQMLLQSIDQNSVKNFTGNVGKLGLSLETVAFDLLFITQHFYLYSQKPKSGEEVTQVLIEDPKNGESVE